MKVNYISAAVIRVLSIKLRLLNILPVCFQGGGSDG